MSPPQDGLENEAPNASKNEPDESSSNVKVYDRPEAVGPSMSTIITIIGIVAVVVLVVAVAVFVL